MYIAFSITLIFRFFIIDFVEWFTHDFADLDDNKYD